jgi:hypothetical protein
MSPRARAAALRAATKVSFAAALVACGRPPAQIVTAETLPPDAAKSPPAVVDLAPAPAADASASDLAAEPRPPAPACDVQDSAKPSPSELACCIQAVPPDGKDAYMRYAADDGGFPPRADSRACCQAIFGEADRSASVVPEPPVVTAANLRRWTCCAAVGNVPKWSVARCTPWGPPVPPAMARA